jgi:membrane protein YdbS with pleckstrin-like domain
MSVFDTDSRLPFSSGVLALAGLLIALLASIVGVALVPVSGLTFVFIVIALVSGSVIAWMAWQLYGYLNSSYTIDRNAFVIRWGPMREIIPMGDVQRVIPINEIEKGLKLRRPPLSGWWRGVGTHPALGRMTFYATDGPGRQLVVVTADHNFVVSPYDTEAFLDAFKARFEMQPTQPIIYARMSPNLLEWPLWRDRIAQGLLLAALALNLGAFGVGLFRFPEVSAQVPLHFDARGIADRLVSKDQLFTPAFIGLTLLIISAGLGVALYWRKERLSAYVLWGGSIAVQAMFAVAMVTIGFSS